MKAAKHILIAFTLLAVSIGVCIPPRSSRSWDHAEPYVHDDTHSISVESESRTTHGLTAQTSPELKRKPLWKDNGLVKRAEDDEIPDVSNARSGANVDRRSGTPTINEIREVLSAEEFERYMELQDGRRAYYRAISARAKRKRNGRKLTRQELRQLEEELETDLRPKMRESQRMDALIRRRLIASGKARPATVEQERARRAKKKEFQQEYLKRPEIMWRKKVAANIKKALSSDQKSAAPTLEEAKEVLSPEEFERYNELLPGRRAYNRAQVAKRKAERAGRKPTPEMIEEMEKNWPMMNERRNMDNLVRRRLIESGKARPKTVAQHRMNREVQSQRESKSIKRKQKFKANREAKKRKDQELEDRINTPQATEQDRIDWVKLEAERQAAREYQKNYRERKSKEKQLRKETQETQAEETKASSEDDSNPLGGHTTTSSNGIENNRVDDPNGHPLQFIDNPLSNGARHLIANLRDRWQAIPWSSYLPRHMTDKPRGGWPTTPWSINRPIASPPVIQGIL